MTTSPVMLSAETGLTINAGAIQTLLTVLVTAVTLYALTVRPVMKRFSRVGELSDALLGEKAIPELGKPERPGLFVAVSRLAATQETQADVLLQVQHTQQIQSAAIEQVRKDVAAIKAGAEVDRLTIN